MFGGFFSRGKTATAQKKKTGDVGRLDDNVLVAVPYHAALRGKTPALGTFPVAGNGPNPLDQIRRKAQERNRKLQAEALDHGDDEEAAPPPSIPRDRTPSMNSNGRTSRPRSAPNRKSSAPVVPAEHTMPAMGSRPPAAFFSRTRSSSIGTLGKPSAKYPLPELPVELQRPGSRPKSFIRSAGRDSSSLRTPTLQSTKERSSISQSRENKNVDIIDAVATMSNAHERATSKHKVKANGLRSYGEDVADRNRNGDYEYRPPSMRVNEATSQSFSSARPIAPSYSAKMTADPMPRLPFSAPKSFSSSAWITRDDEPSQRDNGKGRGRTRARKDSHNSQNSEPPSVDDESTVRGRRTHRGANRPSSGKVVAHGSSTQDQLSRRDSYSSVDTNLTSVTTGSSTRAYYPETYIPKRGPQRSPVNKPGEMRDVSSRILAQAIQAADRSGSSTVSGKSPMSPPMSDSNHSAITSPSSSTHPQSAGNRKTTPNRNTSKRLSMRRASEPEELPSIPNENEYPIPILSQPSPHKKRNRGNSVTYSPFPSTTTGHKRASQEANIRPDSQRMNGNEVAEALNKGKGAARALQKATTSESNGKPAPKSSKASSQKSPTYAANGGSEGREYVDTEVTTRQPVVREHVKSKRHSIREEQVEREIHNYDVYHRTQPVKDTEVKPAKHWVEATLPNGRKTMVELPEDEISDDYKPTKQFVTRTSPNGTLRVADMADMNDDTSHPPRRSNSKQYLKSASPPRSSRPVEMSREQVNSRNGNANYLHADSDVSSHNLYDDEDDESDDPAAPPIVRRTVHHAPPSQSSFYNEPTSSASEKRTSMFENFDYSFAEDSRSTSGSEPYSSSIASDSDNDDGDDYRTPRINSNRFSRNIDNRSVLLDDSQSEERESSMESARLEEDLLFRDFGYGVEGDLPGLPVPGAAVVPPPRTSSLGVPAQRQQQKTRRESNTGNNSREKEAAEKLKRRREELKGRVPGIKVRD